MRLLAFLLLLIPAANAATVMGDYGVSTTGYVSTTQLVTTHVSLTTGSTTWGYISSTGTYLPKLSTDRISTTNISATNFTLSKTPTAGTDVATKAYVDSAVSAAGGGPGCLYAPADIDVDNSVIFSSGQSMAFYTKRFDSNCATKTETRTCTNGLLSGTAPYAKCGLPTAGYRVSPQSACTTCTHKMIIIPVSKPYTLTGTNNTETWNNLNTFCTANGYSAPTSSSSSAPGLWSAGTNTGKPVTSDAWNPVGRWVGGTLMDAFPGGRLWIVGGEPNYLSKATYPSRAVNAVLYNSSDVTVESYNPSYGGSPQITSGVAQSGEFIMCGLPN